MVYLTTKFASSLKSDTIQYCQVTLTHGDNKPFDRQYLTNPEGSPLDVNLTPLFLLPIARHQVSGSTRTLYVFTDC